MDGRERSGAETGLEDGNPRSPVAGRLPRLTGGKRLRERELSAPEQGTTARTRSTAPAACTLRARPRGPRANLAQMSVIMGKSLHARTMAQWGTDHPGRVAVAGRLPRLPSRDPRPTERQTTVLHLQARPDHPGSGLVAGRLPRVPSGNPVVMKYKPTHRSDHPGRSLVDGCRPREPVRNPNTALH